MATFIQWERCLLDGMVAISSNVFRLSAWFCVTPYLLNTKLDKAGSYSHRDSRSTLNTIGDSFFYVSCLTTMLCLGLATMCRNLALYRCRKPIRRWDQRHDVRPLLTLRRFRCTGKRAPTMHRAHVHVFPFLRLVQTLTESTQFRQ